MTGDEPKPKKNKNKSEAMAEAKVGKILYRLANELIDTNGSVIGAKLQLESDADGAAHNVEPVEVPDWVAIYAQEIAKGMKKLASPQSAFMAQVLVSAALRMSAVAALEIVFARCGEYAKRLEKEGDAGNWEALLQDMITMSMRLSPGGVIKALCATESVSKLINQGHQVALTRLTEWLLKRPRLAQRLLPQDSPGVIFEKMPGYHYAPDYFGAAYKKLQPLPEIPVFGELAQRAIESNTCLLNFDRLYTLFNVLMRLANTGTKPWSVVEVGVYKGGTSWFLASVIDLLGLEGSELHACDTFTGHAEEDIAPGTDRHVAGHFADAGVDAVRSRLAPFPFVQIHLGRIQDTAAGLPGRVGLVHLDTDLYEPTLFSLEFFYDRLVRNGAIVVDDYGAKSCPGVAKAVEEFADKHPDAFILPMLTAQCLVLRSGGRA